VQPVRGLARDPDRREEADAQVGLGDVVVDRLRDADERHAGLLMEPQRRRQRPLATDDDESVESVDLDRLLHAAHAVRLVEGADA